MLALLCRRARLRLGHSRHRERAAGGKQNFLRANTQAVSSPKLINLLRALSYQKRMLSEAALSAAAQDSLQATVDDLTETLRTVLCL